MPMQSEISVTHKGDTFNIKIPSVREDIAITARACAILRETNPETTYTALDSWTQAQLRACAVFEQLLKTSSAKWPYSEGPSGPIVDSAKFPHDKFDDVMGVYFDWAEKLTTFRSGGNPAQPSTPPEAAPGIADPGRPEPI